MPKSFDCVVEETLDAFAAEVLNTDWCGKEHDWVNRYAHGCLLKRCSPGSEFFDPAQLAIEVGVPQPSKMEPGSSPPVRRFTAAAVRRDLVVWREPGQTCWSADWNAVNHPLAILEWKVHRPRRKNRDQPHERKWLTSYSREHPAVYTFAVEVRLDEVPKRLDLFRFDAGRPRAPQSYPRSG